MIVRIYTLLYLMVLFTACSCQNNLPMLNILSKEPINWEEKTACQINYAFQNSDTTLDAAIKFRGGMSSAYDKHSFSIELVDKYTFKSLPHDDDWVLNASYIDKTFMRHKISYDLFREMSYKNLAAKCEYVEVKIDGTYEGLYVLMEQVNAGMLHLNKKDSMAMLFKDPLLFYKDKNYAIVDSVNYYHQKYPKIAAKDFTNYIESFRSFLFSTSDTYFEANIDNWIDVDNIIDWHLLLLLTNNSDGIMKNFYLYKQDSKTPFRIAIWDYDHSFGRDGDNELNMDRELDCNRSILFKRLSEVAKYNARLAKRWHQLRKTGLFSVAHIDELIKENHTVIKGAIVKNQERWPIDSKWYFDANEYATEVTIIKEFVNKRLKELDLRFMYSG